ncbi:MAG: SpoIIIAH-like family protein [Lachnospira pectinoschiza]
MKRVKKNQVIITALAIMIAVAGYINYAGNISDIISVSSKSGSKVVNTSTDDTIFTEEEPDDESLEEPGSVILTSGQGVSSGESLKLSLTENRYVPRIQKILLI